LDISIVSCLFVEVSEASSFTSSCEVCSSVVVVVVDADDSFVVVVGVGRDAFGRLAFFGGAISSGYT